MLSKTVANDIQFFFIIFRENKTWQMIHRKCQALFIPKIQNVVCHVTFVISALRLKLKYIVHCFPKPSKRCTKTTTIITLNIWTDRPEQTVQTQTRCC